MTGWSQSRKLSHLPSTAEPPGVSNFSGEGHGGEHSHPLFLGEFFDNRLVPGFGSKLMDGFLHPLDFFFMKFQLAQQTSQRLTRSRTQRTSFGQPRKPMPEWSGPALPAVRWLFLPKPFQQH